MRFNRFLHLIAFSFSGKAHRGSPASGGVTTKMLDAGAPSQAKRTPDFGRYLPLSGGGPGLPSPAIPAATAGAAGLFAVSGAWTGLFRFKETTPIRHLRTARRGMSLPPPPVPLSPRSPPQHRKGAGNQGQLPRPERPAGAHLGGRPHSTVSSSMFFTLRAHREIYGSKLRHTQLAMVFYHLY